MPTSARTRYLLFLTLSSIVTTQKAAGSQTGAHSQDPRCGLITREQFDEDVNRSRQVEWSEELLYHMDDLHNKTSFSDLNRLCIQAKVYVTIYSDLLMQRYDNVDELAVSGGPQVNHELCLKQLGHLNERVNILSREKYASEDINMLQLLDTFGREPAGRLLGSFYWPGAYEECLRLSIETPEGQVPTRYCVAHKRGKDWPIGDSPVDSITAIKSGICLPKSCDSSPYENKYDLILGLMQVNIHKIERGALYLSDLYCLPDSASPIRTWWMQPKPVVIVLLLLTWISLLLCATFKTRSEKTEHLNKIFSALSIKNNLKLLFDTSKISSLIDIQTKTHIERQPLVDLRVLEGIKVISMIYVILGHVLMCLSHIMSNGRDTAGTFSPFFFLANLAPAFAVNSFFTITGLLTSYLIFKQNQSFSFISSPIKWLAFIAYRYARIMPMYILVVAYAKYLAKFTGSGPFWDYGTSALAHRRTCEEESWLWTVLFAANFKSPLSHCIPSAWYLANDFQFFLVTPVFLSLLHARPRLGQALIYTCIALGCMAGFTSVYNADLDDLRPIARFMPHGFKTYVTHLHANYTRPQNRIPAYLCGLLVGYYLFVYERDRLDSEKEDDKKLDWPISLKEYGATISALIVVICIIMPILGSLIPFNKWWARFAVAFVMPVYHLLFSLSAGLYILLATTGYGNRHLNALLSLSLWKPLARLSLCVVLVNVEVIIYLTQTRTRSMFMDNLSYLSINIVSILASYLAATALSALFEAPIRAALGYLLSCLLSTVANKRRTKKNK